MKYFNSWEDVKGFMQIGCVSIDGVGVFYGTSWQDDFTGLHQGGYTSDELLALMKNYTVGDVSKVNLEWVGG